jgi:hypothetical protein
LRVAGSSPAIIVRVEVRAVIIPCCSGFRGRLGMPVRSAGEWRSRSRRTYSAFSRGRLGMDVP